MNTLTEYAPAKVNLYLRVVGTRPDGYHDIETLFEKVGIIDTITLTSRDSGIHITSDQPAIPTDRRNICYQAARLIMDRCGVSGGIDIAIGKRIPVAAGLGGGSSDAAAVLRGLNTLWGIGLTIPELMAFGAEIGSDVPFFCGRSAFAFGKGRGDNIIPCDWSCTLAHLFVTPPISLLSGNIYTIYGRTREKASFALTSNIPIDTILPPNEKVDIMGKSKALLRNDLEDAVLAEDPIISDIQTFMIDSGAANALVSGSGPSVFGLFESVARAEQAREALFDQFTHAREWNVVVAGTYGEEHRKEPNHGDHRS